MVLAGRYLLRSSIGRGGMGEVFRAEDLLFGTPLAGNGRVGRHGTRRAKYCAIKVLRATRRGSTYMIDRLRREAEILSRIEHPGVVAFHDWGVLENGSVFLAMELLEGLTLARFLESHTRPTPSELLPIVHSICEGLAAIHEAGVLHRDLKPQNIFLARNPNGALQVKIIDFGVARRLGLSRITVAGQVLGTPVFMSPEQVLGRDLDGRADVYALGAMVYAALGGTLPPWARRPSMRQMLERNVPPLSDVVPEVPVSVSDFVARCMAADREERPPSAPAFAAEYTRAVISASAEDETLADCSMRKQSRMVPAILMGMILASIAAGVGYCSVRAAVQSNVPVSGAAEAAPLPR